MAFDFTRHPTTPDAGEGQPLTRPQRVLSLMADNQERTSRQITDALADEETSINRALRVLRERGQIDCRTETRICENAHTGPYKRPVKVWRMIGAKHDQHARAR